MTTVSDIGYRAMRLIGAIGVGETMTTDESADMLESLQAMMDSWNTERLFVYYIKEDTLTLTGGDAEYTMGPSGDINTTRPVRIDNSCFVRFNSIDFPLQLIEVQAWNSIPAKDTASNIPMYLYVVMEYPLIKLKVYTEPTSASAVLHISSWKPLQAFAALTDDLALPPGYLDAITYSLAERIAPEYGKELPVTVARTAARCRANIKRVNAPMRNLRLEVGYMNGTRWSDNIYNGA